jgi:hypothetical protein
MENKLTSNLDRTVTNNSGVSRILNGDKPSLRERGLVLTNKEHVTATY